MTAARLRRPPALPSPHGLEFLVWSSLVTEALARYGVREAVSQDAWKDWASSLLYQPELASIPTHDGFADWSEWASRVVEANL